MLSLKNNNFFSHDSVIWCSDGWFFCWPGLGSHRWLQLANGLAGDWLVPNGPIHVFGASAQNAGMAGLSCSMFSLVLRS